MTTTFTLIKPEDLIVEFDGGSVLIRLRATNEFIRSMTREEAAALSGLNKLATAREEANSGTNLGF
jgi:hypothetical protein